MNSHSNILGYPKKRHKLPKNKIIVGKSNSSILSNSAAKALPEEQALFIHKTYLHLAIAMASFVGLEAILINLNIIQYIYFLIRSGWIMLVAFAIIMLISLLIAGEMTKSTSSKMQYWGFGIYILTEVIMIAPVLYIIQNRAGIGIIEEAGVITIGLFTGITALVFLRHKDFSFFLTFLIIGGFITLGYIASGIVFGFSIRSLFTFGMVVLAGGWMVFNTKNIMNRYQINQYVAASISLFSSVVWLFWAILRSYSYGSRVLNSEVNTSPETKML